MQKGQVYKHRSCVDICIHVDEVLYEDPEGGLKLKVRYCDERGLLFHKDVEIVTIPVHQLPNWKLARDKTVEAKPLPIKTQNWPTVRKSNA